MWTTQDSIGPHHTTHTGPTSGQADGQAGLGLGGGWENVSRAIGGRTVATEGPEAPPSHPGPWHSAVEAMEQAFAAGDLDGALRVVRERPESFLEWAPDVPLDRLEAWLDVLQASAPDDPWLLYCRAWAWSTKRNHTLALLTLKRAGQRFVATLATGSAQLRHAGFLLSVAEGTVAELKAAASASGQDGPASMHDVFMTHTGRSLDDDVEQSPEDGE
jgi:hypothetical protein